MDENINFDFDVIVLGCGASGMLAAISAYENGLKVGIFEKDSVVGGTAAISGGIIWAPMNSHMKDADIYDIDTIVEKMDSLGWSDRNITIEFNKRKLQAFDVGAGAAKLQYVLKVSNMDIIKFEIRYKGNFTSQPQFLAVFTNKFKALLK